MACTEEIVTVGKKVRAFYEQCSFPDYEETDTPFDLSEKARRSVYTKMLDDQIPCGVKVLDAGCGSGQLAIFLSTNDRKTVGIDFSMGSLRKGQDFKSRFHLKNVAFLQMDLFHPALKEEVFDYVFCIGVLHHTADAYRGFKSLCRLVKKGGYVIIGLYNRYGRLLVGLRRLLFRASRNRLAWLDYIVRTRGAGDPKSKVWYLDQYNNPHEVKFSVEEVLRWFRDNGVKYINSIPAIRVGTQLTPDARLFEPRDAGAPLEHLLCQLSWILTKGREGGVFHNNWPAWPLVACLGEDA
jgi:ubiquinone/menaquinone biosynthesis C-methylase UbiE